MYSGNMAESLRSCILEMYNIAVENHHTMHGKIHYSNGHFQLLCYKLAEGTCSSGHFRDKIRMCFVAKSPGQNPQRLEFKVAHLETMIPRQPNGYWFLQAEVH